MTSLRDRLVHGALFATALVIGCTDPPPGSGSSVGELEDTGENNANNANNAVNNSTPDAGEDVPPTEDINLFEDVPVCEGELALRVIRFPDASAHPGIIDSHGPLPVGDRIMVHLYSDSAGAEPGLLELATVGLDRPGEEITWLTDGGGDDYLVDASEALNLRFVRRRDGATPLILRPAGGQDVVVVEQHAGLNGLFWGQREQRLVSGDRAVWWDPGATRVSMWEDGAIRDISAAIPAVSWPWFGIGLVAWVVSPDGNQRDIAVWDGQATRVITQDIEWDDDPVVAGGRVVWNHNGQLSAWSPQTGAVTTLREGGCTPLASNGSRAAAACSMPDTNTSDIVVTDGEEIEVVAQAQSQVFAVTIEGNYVAWTEYTSEVGPEAGQVWLARISDKQVYEVATVGVGCPSCQVPWPIPSLAFRGNVLAWNYGSAGEQPEVGQGGAAILMGCNN